MEFLVELLLDVFGELLLQLLFEGLAELGLQAFKKRHPQRPAARLPLRLLGYLLLGLLAGGVSLWLVPHSLMHSLATRQLNLLLAPIAAGLVMALLSAWRQPHGQQLLRGDRFACGYVFALAMAVVRFVWTT